MLLSVLTVGFFAVVLFPRDEVRAGRRALNDPIAGPILGAASLSPGPDVVPIAAPIVSATVEPAPVASAPIASAPVASALAEPAPVANTSVEPAPRERRDGPASASPPHPPVAALKAAPVASSASPGNQPPQRPLVPAPMVAIIEPPAAPDVSRAPAQSRASAREVVGPPAVTSVSRRPSRPVRRPVASVTVAGPKETIRDVALRVYGSTAPIDQLWRANRDVLPERDTPLRPGTLLRTPAPKSRD